MTNASPVAEPLPAQPAAGEFGPADPVEPTRVRITPTRIRALDSALAAAFKANTRVNDLALELLAGRQDDESSVAAAIEGIRLDVLNGDIEAAQRASAKLLTEFGSLL